MNRAAFAAGIGLMIALGMPDRMPARAPEGDSNAPPAARGWTLGELYTRSGVFLTPARKVRLGPDTHGRAWDFSQPDRGNFTFFEGVTNVWATSEGALAVTLTDTVGTLGWGNYGGLQPDKERVAFRPRFTLSLNVRQSRETPTAFTVRYWSGGKRGAVAGKGFSTAEQQKTLSGTNWQALTFPAYRPLSQDGFDFELKGEAGNRIEFKDLEISHYEAQGYFRKQFVLPTGAVWRAVAEVGAMTYLYVNGQEVPSPSGERPYGMYGSESLDLASYFEPGKPNVIAVYGRREGTSAGYLPFICMQGSVVMRSGERVSLDTDGSWKWAREAPEGWTRRDFDDSGWAGTDQATDDGFRVQPNWVLNRDRSAPVDDGPLRLAHPEHTQFYFTDRQDLVVHGYAPAGLAGKQPALAWTLGRYEAGAVADIALGVATEFEADGDSIRCTLNLGPRPRGIYLLTAVLKAGPEILHEAIPEPLVVTGWLPMQETDGETYTQDMDLELERTIDLTDPKDGPWLEASGIGRAPAPVNDPAAGIHEAAIVTRGGLTYRETQPHAGAVISYLHGFRHPGDFYLLELDYPNDMRRMMGVACCPRNWGLSSPATYSKTSAAVCTGDRYPVTGSMQTLRWLYRPDPGNHALNLVTLLDMPAAGAALRLYHIRNGLPALRAPERHTRWNGLLTERTRANPDRFGIEEKPPIEDPAEARRQEGPEAAIQPVLKTCANLAKHLDSCEAFARYMRFTGQNVHIMGSYQYHRGNPPSYDPEWIFPCSRVKGDIRDVFARVMRDNGIDFYAHIEYVFSPELMAVADKRPARPETGFWDTPYLVEPKGREYINWEGKYGLNFNHPAVRQAMLFTPADMARKFRALPNFKGIAWTPYFGGDFLPTYRGRLPHGRGLFHVWTVDEFTYYGYGDVTLREFERETGLTLPFSLDDPDRFQKRHDYLNTPAMRPAWYAWRAARMKSFFRDVADTVRRQRPDLKCVCNLYMNPIHDSEWRASGLSFDEYMRANAWDGRLFAADDAVSLTHIMYGVLNKQPEAGVNRGWDMSADPERFRFFQAERDRSVQVKHDWWEVEGKAWLLPPRPDWPRYMQMTLMGQPDGNNTREVFTRALIGADPDLVFYGFADATLFEGNEQPLREFNRVLRALPSEKFQPAAGTGLDTELALRELRRNDEYWFYAANPGYWPVSGEIVLAGAGPVLDAVTGQPAAEPGPDGRATVQVTLAPFGVAAFRTAAKQASMDRWSAAARKGLETAHLEGIVRDTEALMRNPAALATLRAEDEEFMRATLAAAAAALAEGRYAAALLATSADRFWTLKNEFLAKGAEFATGTERDPQAGQDRKTGSAVAAGAAPVIDARPDDAVWKQAPVWSGFVASDGTPAMARTSFQAAYDREALYLLVRCDDRTPAAIKRTASPAREVTVFQDDCILLFLQPDPGSGTYYHLAVSAGSVKLDQRVKGGARDYDFAPPWEARAAVTESGWVAELKLPAASFEGPIEPGGAWRVNLHRSIRDRAAPVTSWSYSPVDAHDTGRFGTLTFAR